MIFDMYFNWHMEKSLHEDHKLFAELKLSDRKIYQEAKYKGIPDQKIWEDFKLGDETAFIHIYSTHFKELISFGYQFCRDMPLVEDSIQDIIVDLRRKRNALPPIKHSIRLYLFQALKRRIINYQKKVRNINLDNNYDNYVFEICLPHEAVLISEQVHAEISERINHAISQLTSRQREALYYLYFKNMSYEEIRILMGIDNVKSVRNLIYKAITTLRPLLETVFFAWIIILHRIFSPSF
jgi:RNA polymerase sigma factor (sigma-70 family)